MAGHDPFAGGRCFPAGRVIPRLISRDAFCHRGSSPRSPLSLLPPPLPYTPQNAVRTPMLPTLSLTNNSIARPHIWLLHRTGGGAPHPVSQVCTSPSNYRKFTCQHSLESTTEVKIRCPPSIQIQSRYSRRRPSDYMPKFSITSGRPSPRRRRCLIQHCAVIVRHHFASSVARLLCFLQACMCAHRQSSAAFPHL